MTERDIEIIDRMGQWLHRVTGGPQEHHH